MHKCTQKKNESTLIIEPCRDAHGVEPTCSPSEVLPWLHQIDVYLYVRIESSDILIRKTKTAPLAGRRRGHG